MGRETESAYRRRESTREMVRQIDTIVRPDAEAKAACEAEALRIEMEQDQLGYVWWRIWRGDR